MPTTRSASRRKDLVDNVAGRARGKDILSPAKQKEQTARPASPRSESGSVSSASSNNSRTHLPKFIQKQLAIDIEKAGGIDACGNGNGFKLLKLCDKRVDGDGNYFYGSQSSSLRRKVQKKVDRWKELSRDDLYQNRVLDHFRILSFEALKKAGLATEILNESSDKLVKESGKVFEREEVPIEVFTSSTPPPATPRKSPCPVNTGSQKSTMPAKPKAVMSYKFNPQDKHEVPIPENVSKSFSNGSVANSSRHSH